MFISRGSEGRERSFDSGGVRLRLRDVEVTCTSQHLSALSPAPPCRTRSTRTRAYTSIYITWICTLGGALLGNWVWWLAMLIPGFAGWKLFGVAKPFLGMFLPGLFGPSVPKDESAAAAAATGPEPGESRKQAKLRARMEKGDKRVQAVRR